MSVLTRLIAALAAFCGSGQATAPAERITPPAHIILMGDSIARGLCDIMPAASCVAFPGAFVAGPDGHNFINDFVAMAAPTAGDLVVLSNVGGFHSAEVDDDEIIRRLATVVLRVQYSGARLVFLLQPDDGLPACGLHPSAAAIANFGATDPATSCATMDRVHDAIVGWGVDTLTINGPYVEDEIHQTDAAKAGLAAEITDMVAG